MYIVLRPDTRQYEMLSGATLFKVAKFIAEENSDGEQILGLDSAVIYLRALGWRIKTC